MIHLDIPPFSTNKMYKGRKVLTEDCARWKRDIAYILPSKVDIPKGVPLFIFMDIGVSNAFDWDNSIKTFQDALQEKYGFNDNKVHFGAVKKNIVGKGEEYIDWIVRPLDEVTITISYET